MRIAPSIGCDDDTHRRPEEAPMFRIGEEVFGRDGKLGELSRVVVDPGTHDVTYVVIRHGMLRTSERLLPVAVLESHGEAYADITGDDFEQLQLFDLSHYRAPDPDYTGPPGFDATAAGGANTQLDAYVALGPLTTMGAAARVMGFPGGEASTISRDAPLPAGRRRRGRRPRLRRREAGRDRDAGARRRRPPRAPRRAPRLPLQHQRPTCHPRSSDASATARSLSLNRRHRSRTGRPER